MQDTAVSTQKFNFIYHNISNRFNIGINNISPKSFEKHLDFFAHFSDISICFDDAYGDEYTSGLQLGFGGLYNSSHTGDGILAALKITEILSKYNLKPSNGFNI